MNQHLPNLAMAAPWTLVVAGVSPLGRSRAARAVATAIGGGMNVLVLDGQVPPLTQTDLDTGDHPTTIHVYSVGETERSGLAFRMIEPTHPTRRSAWRVTGRRIGSLIRPWRFWSLSKRAVESLEDGPPPKVIVCCDEVSITTAWKAAKIWPGAQVRGG